MFSFALAWSTLLLNRLKVPGTRGLVLVAVVAMLAVATLLTIAHVGRHRRRDVLPHRGDRCGARRPQRGADPGRPRTAPPGLTRRLVRRGEGVVRAEAPDVALRVAGDEVARAVVLVAELALDLGAGAVLRGRTARRDRPRRCTRPGSRRPAPSGCACRSRRRAGSPASPCRCRRSAPRARSCRPRPGTTSFSSKPKPPSGNGSRPARPRSAGRESWSGRAPSRAA